MASLLTRLSFPVFIILLGLLLVATACGNDTSGSLEERAQSINKGLMCPVCPGETIDQAQVQLASQMRAIVRNKLEEGWSRDQVLQFFVDRYGERVLASPSKDGFNLLVWVFPPLVGLGAVILLLVVVRSMSRGYDDLVAPPEDSEIETYLTRADVERGESGVSGNARNPTKVSADGES